MILVFQRAGILTRISGRDSPANADLSRVDGFFDGNHGHNRPPGTAVIDPAFRTRHLTGPGKHQQTLKMSRNATLTDPSAILCGATRLH